MARAIGITPESEDWDDIWVRAKELEDILCDTFTLR
jgi:hypothetical protein